MEVIITLTILMLSVGIGQIGYNAAKYGITISHVMLMLLGGALPYIIGYLIGKAR